jgi:sulfotransferase family protein
MNIVFIIGTGRCGSSFVHEILARHEDVGFISNVEDNLPINNLGKWNNSIYRSFAGQFTRKGNVRFAPSEAYRLISKEVSPIYANSCRDLNESDVTPWLEHRFADFFGKRAIAQKKALFSHKYTGWPRIGFFRKMFPEAKFIHIVRDGRAVANSWLQMPWWNGYRGPENWLWGALPPPYEKEWAASGYAFEVLAAIAWKMLMQQYHQAESVLTADQYLTIRYEDILEAPDTQFSRMLDFCGLAQNDRFSGIVSGQRIIKSRSRAFEVDLDQNQLRNVENSLHEMLHRYGYI